MALPPGGGQQLGGGGGDFQAMIQAIVGGPNPPAAGPWFANSLFHVTTGIALGHFAAVAAGAPPAGWPAFLAAAVAAFRADFIAWFRDYFLSAATAAQEQM